ncbi:MAG: polyprenyl synthetase family protein [Candidatus Kerfeldbacteria bacterium]|nr:polyprenyl synthetase family protein [Candidatus Kerfeldbacteria bacterium]
MTLDVFKARFDAAFRSVLDRQLAAAKQVTADHSLGQMLRYTRTFMLGGGKRLRPYLAYLGYATGGGRQTPAIFNVTTALELFHVFCLIQDDVIDCSAERHGMRTVHEELRGNLGRMNRVGDARHISQGEAILIGDLLAGWAEDIINQSTDWPAARVRAAAEIFRTMRTEVIVGQLLDVDTSTRPAISNALIREKLILKSARYSFVRPLQFGLALAGAARQRLSFADRFGTALGSAFQIQDDLLDLTGDANTVGKSLLNDIRQHQHTPFTQFVLTQGSYVHRKQLLHWFGGDVEPRDHGAILEMFERSGAIDYGRKIIAKHLADAEAQLKRQSLSPALRTAFQGLVDAVSRRAS